MSSGINQIVEQLGGALGEFSVSIGKYKDNFRVNVGGKPLGGVTGSGATDFGKDQNAAVGFAISLAIQQGAVKGLSTAVQKAIGSSPDIEKALREATRVQQLELLIGGLGASLNKTFKDFDAAAGDRVSLAKKYGLDILAVEKINGEERVKLLDDTLKSRVGSLKDFLKNVQYGDLFEGTASERRSAILAEIKTAQADAEAGVAGAADQLEQLYRTLIDTSREAFGTAGPEFTTDRTSAISGVERVIAIETDRIKAAADAQASTTKAIQDGNKLADEGNDLLAIMNSKIDLNNDALAAILQSLGSRVLGADFGSTRRVATLDDAP